MTEPLLKEPAKSGFEQDAIYTKGIYRYLAKSGICRKAKRKINRRSRKEWNIYMKSIYDDTDNDEIYDDTNQKD